MTLHKVNYTLFVPGIPKAQPRPRMTRTGHAYNPDSAKEWKRAIQAAFLPLRKETIDEPVEIAVCFFMPRPKSMKRPECFIPHTKKPDGDNLIKAVMDALTDIKIWSDDSMVFDARAIKCYATEEPGAGITIRTGFLHQDDGEIIKQKEQKL
jgi:Holliday junction resolvase RusA-like endonuclease